MRILIREHVGLDVAEGRLRLVLVAVVEGLDDVFLETRATRMCMHHRLALRVAVFGISQSKHVHFDAGRHQSDDRVHVLRDARRRVQGDRGPNRFEVLLLDCRGFAGSHGRHLRCQPRSVPARCCADGSSPCRGTSRLHKAVRDRISVRDACLPERPSNRRGSNGETAAAISVSRTSSVISRASLLSGILIPVRSVFMVRLIVIARFLIF